MMAFPPFGNPWPSNFNFERAKPFSFYKGHFHSKVLKSPWETFLRGTKAKTRGALSNSRPVTTGGKDCKKLLGTVSSALEKSIKEHDNSLYLKKITTTFHRSCRLV